MCGGESHWLGLLLPLAQEVSSSSTSELSACFASCIIIIHNFISFIILSPSILKYPDHPVFEYLTALGMHASCVGQQPPAHLSGHGCQLLSHWNVNK